MAATALCTRPRPAVTNSGTSASGANFDRPAITASAPRAIGRPVQRKAASTSAPTSASLAPELATSSVNGNVTQR
jgi:hypothetical protein